VAEVVNLIERHSSFVQAMVSIIMAVIVLYFNCARGGGRASAESGRALPKGQSQDRRVQERGGASRRAEEGASVTGALRKAWLSALLDLAPAASP